MSALAHIMISMGHKVSGSDIKGSIVTNRLENMGAEIYYNHDDSNIIDSMDYIVVSSAIAANNCELVASKEKKIAIIHRGELLAQLFNTHKGIAVAGAHGKTTTTSMLAVALSECGFSPTVLIGGDVPYFNGNAQKGSGEIMVAEADESDGSFLFLKPEVAIITNIEDDHLDYYGSMEKVEQAFFDFTYRASQSGIVILCTDNEKVRELSENIDNKITYGLNTGEVTAKNISYLGLGVRADIFYQEQPLGPITLNVPGKHNLLNALGVIGAGIFLGIKFEEISAGISKFTGVKRRFQVLGQVGDITVVDDYAHHPTEIIATLSAAKNAVEGRLVAIFQPHRYSRTKALYKQFAAAFSDADVVILDEVYAAGETSNQVSSSLIVNSMNHNHVHFCPGKENILQLLNNILEPGDLVITLGAGDIWQVSHKLLGTN